MADSAELLRGCRVLVLEDEYLLADDLERMLREHGAEVVGPIAAVREAFDAVMRDGFDMAIMNVTLQGQNAFDLADELTRQRVPFMFVTGFAAKAIPDRFRSVKLREKPCVARDIANDVAHLCTERAARRGL
ncbi:response regulator [Bradyrhizobium sp. UFLA05-109]